jgi:hypothetical protein
MLARAPAAVAAPRDACGRARRPPLRRRGARRARARGRAPRRARRRDALAARDGRRAGRGVGASRAARTRRGCGACSRTTTRLRRSRRPSSSSTRGRGCRRSRRPRHRGPRPTRPAAARRPRSAPGMTPGGRSPARGLRRTGDGAAGRLARPRPLLQHCAQYNESRPSIPYATHGAGDGVTVSTRRGVGTPLTQVTNGVGAPVGRRFLRSRPVGAGTRRHPEDDRGSFGVDLDARHEETKEGAALDPRELIEARADACGEVLQTPRHPQRRDRRRRPEAGVSPRRPPAWAWGALLLLGAAPRLAALAALAATAVALVPILSAPLNGRVPLHREQPMSRTS